MPEIVQSPSIVTSPLIVQDYIKPENYFSTDVMLIDLEKLREKKNLITEKTNFAIKNIQFFQNFAQDIFNSCFANDYLKLPTRFNCKFRKCREDETDIVDDKIYCYDEQSLGVDTEDIYNNLFWESFIKTPYLNPTTLGIIYRDSRQIFKKRVSDMYGLAIFMTSLMSGKTRAFYISPKFLEQAKETLKIRADEEIILADSAYSIQKLIGTMKNSNNKRVLFLLLESSDLMSVIAMELEKNGFEENKDFINVLNLLTDNKIKNRSFYQEDYELIKNL